MVNRVVSTKLTEEEHSKLLDEGNMRGCTPSTFIKELILKQFMTEEEDKAQEEKQPLELERLLKALTK
jgi:hypothetical protein